MNSTKLDKVMQYNEKSVKIVEVDVEKIKQRPNQYIGYYGALGFRHLIIEAIQNSIDEGMSAELDWNVEIYVQYDENTKEIIVEDTGRGIPHGSIEQLFTVIQASGKFDSQNYGLASSGENGCGATAITALSTRLEVISTRGGKKCTVVFEHGYPVSNKIEDVENKLESGTVVKFTPDEKILGKCNLNHKLIDDWIGKIYYCCKGLKFVYHAKRKGRNSDFHREYVNKEGLKEYLYDNKNENLLFEPFHILDTETVIGEKYENGKMDISLECLVGYDTSKNEETVDSFCNFVNTIDNGHHVTGARMGIGQVMLENAKKYIPEKEFSKLNINIEDARTGLYLILNLRAKKPEFVGQNKEKVNNEDLKIPIKNILYRNIKKILEDDVKLAKNLAMYVKKCAEQRRKSKAAKESALKDIVIVDRSYFSSDMPEKFYPVVDPNGLFKGRYELLYIEG